MKCELSRMVLVAPSPCIEIRVLMKNMECNVHIIEFKYCNLLSVHAPRSFNYLSEGYTEL
jgi:hypothetical protein